MNNFKENITSLIQFLWRENIPGRKQEKARKLQGCVGYVYSQLQSLETMPGAEQAAFSQTRTSKNRLSSSRELLWFLWTRFS
ncbi:hypothetical protein MHYP_G00277800 [Metynnis hypsauchen]